MVSRAIATEIIMPDVFMFLPSHLKPREAPMAIMIAARPFSILRNPRKNQERIPGMVPIRDPIIPKMVFCLLFLELSTLNLASLRYSL